MACMFLGGVYFASAMLKDDEGKTMLAKSFGLIALPVCVLYYLSSSLPLSISFAQIYLSRLLL